MTSIKPGVSLRGLTPQTILAIIICGQVFDEFEIDLVVTRGTEDAPNSTPHTRHKVGNAFDARKRTVPQSLWSALVDACQNALGTEYQMTISPNNFHIEWDPR